MFAWHDKLSSVGKICQGDSLKSISNRSLASSCIRCEGNDNNGKSFTEADLRYLQCLYVLCRVCRIRIRSDPELFVGSRRKLLIKNWFVYFKTMLIYVENSTICSSVNIFNTLKIVENSSACSPNVKHFYMVWIFLIWPSKKVWFWLGYGVTIQVGSGSGITWKVGSLSVSQ